MILLFCNTQLKDKCFIDHHISLITLEASICEGNCLEVMAENALI